MSTQHRAILVAHRAQQAAVDRWHAIRSFIGRRMRCDNAAPTAALPREPHAPGFEPKPGELFVTSDVVVDVADDQGAIDRRIERALFALESKLRDRMRSQKVGDNIVPPALALGRGDRIYPVLLQGVTSYTYMPIRVASRMQSENSTKLRIDFELMLAIASGADQLENISGRMVPALAQITTDSVALLPSLKVLLGHGTVMADDLVQREVVAVVCTGTAAPKLREFIEGMVREMKSEAGGDANPEDQPPHAED